VHDNYRLVLLESPYAGDVDGNVQYARRCVRDCILRGDAPIASHLLYTQAGILDDTVHAEREHGMAAGWAWLEAVDAVVVYTDRGISEGMRRGVVLAIAMGVPVEYRQLDR
jgi:hypothetical protein